MDRHIHMILAPPTPHKYTGILTYSLPPTYTDRCIFMCAQTHRQARAHTLPDPPTHRHALTHAAGALVVSSVAAAVTFRSLGPLSGLCLTTSCSRASSSKLALQTLSRDRLILSPTLLSAPSPHLSSASHCLFPSTCSPSLFLSLSLSRPILSLSPDLALGVHLSPAQTYLLSAPRSVTSLPPSSALLHALTVPVLLLCPLAPSCSPPLAPHLGLWNHSWFSLGGGGARLFIGACSVMSVLPPPQPLCLQDPGSRGTWERKERWVGGSGRGAIREGGAPGGSRGVAEVQKGSRLGELAPPKPPPSTSCPRAREGQGPERQQGGGWWY